MSEKRYFKIEYDEEWYLFDSTTISEQLVKEQAEYGYGVFANSLSPSEVVGLLNEQQSTITNLQGDVNRLNYIIEELRTKSYKQFEKINELKKENEKLKNRLNDEYIKECSL